MAASTTASSENRAAIVCEAAAPMRLRRSASAARTRIHRAACPTSGSAAQKPLAIDGAGGSVIAVVVGSDRPHPVADQAAVGTVHEVDVAGVGGADDSFADGHGLGQAQSEPFRPVQGDVYVGGVEQVAQLPLGQVLIDEHTAHAFDSRPQIRLQQWAVGEIDRLHHQPGSGGVRPERLAVGIDHSQRVLADHRGVEVETEQEHHVVIDDVPPFAESVPVGAGVEHRNDRGHDVDRLGGVLAQGTFDERGGGPDLVDPADSGDEIGGQRLELPVPGPDGVPAGVAEPEVAGGHGGDLVDVECHQVDRVGPTAGEMTQFVREEVVDLGGTRPDRCHGQGDTTATQADGKSATGLGQAGGGGEVPDHVDPGAGRHRPGRVSPGRPGLEPFWSGWHRG